MGTKKYLGKLDEYYSRLEDGKAEKIKPDHVAKVIRKLCAKRAERVEELEEATKPDKKARIAAKIAVLDDQVARAEALLAEIGGAGD